MQEQQNGKEVDLMKPQAFRFPESLLEGARQRADDQGLELSEYIRNLVSDDLNQVYMDKNAGHRFSHSGKIRLPGELLIRLSEHAKFSGVKLEELIQQTLESIF